MDYAARTASELGADVVKVNFPHPEKRYRRARRRTTREFSSPAGHRRRGPVGQPDPAAGLRRQRAGDEAMLEKARQSMEAGATGLIFGRNVWQREHDESLRFVTQLQDILAKYPSS